MSLNTYGLILQVLHKVYPLAVWVGLLIGLGLQTVRIDTKIEAVPDKQILVISPALR